MSECQIRKVAGQNYRFTGDNLDGYQIDSGVPNDCKGDPVTGLISAVPVSTNEYPRFDLSNSSGSFTCTFKGTTYQKPKQCLDMICGNASATSSSQSNTSTATPSPPNTSSLFPNDSGFACRTVDSNQMSFGYGYVYLDGRDSVELEIQPVTIAAGQETWDISGVKTTIEREPCYATNDRCSDSQWLVDFANAVVDTVNSSDSNYSAELDPSGNGQIIFYSPTGEVDNSISMEVSRQVINSPWNSAANGTNPWAYPSLGGDVMTDRTYYGNRTFNSGQSSVNATSTTICDGKG